MMKALKPRTVNLFCHAVATFMEVYQLKAVVECSMP